MPSPTQELPVLISGAGIAGLALAHGLQNHSIPFRIFERSPAHESFRAQGYRIRIAAEGMTALQYLLDSETYQDFELTCAETRLRPIPGIDAVKGEVDDGAWKDRKGGEGPKEQRGEVRTVDRTVMREVLLKGLEGKVEFGKSLLRYEELEDGGVRAQFEDGSTADGCLLVGAEGAKSPVRKQYLPDLRILDTGGRCIYGKTPLTPRVLEALQPEIAKGMSAVKDRSQEDIMSLILEPVTWPSSQRQDMAAAGFKCPEDYLYWVLVAKPQRMCLDEKEGKTAYLTNEEAEELAKDLTKNWHPNLRTIFENQKHGESSLLAISSVPSDLVSWDPSQNITLIGDAVHLMGPTAGSGAITALRDAYLLCQTVVSEGLSKETIGKYESTMREYASKTVYLSWMGAQYIFGLKRGEGGKRNLSEVMMEIRERRGRD